MITKNTTVSQLPKAIEQGFSALEIGKHLRHAGITKGLGFTCLEIFQVLFLLVFTHKNWHRTLTTKNSTPFGKDVIYRFLIILLMLGGSFCCH
jgi:hypothetical protein